MQNKKGTDKILSVYWFVVLTLIAGGIFAMVYLFYGTPYDVREIESELFVEKIADCISKQGVIDPAFFSDKGEFTPKVNETFLKKCGITFNVEGGYAQDIQYLYVIDFYDGKDYENLVYYNKFKPPFYMYGGNLNYYYGNINSPEYAGTLCEFSDVQDKYTRLATCTERRFYAVDENNKQYLIKIVGTIGKSEKNVKQ